MNEFEKLVYQMRIYQKLDATGKASLSDKKSMANLEKQVDAHLSSIVEPMFIFF